MDRTEAVEAVTLYGATASRPALTADDVAKIVDRHAIPDTDGRMPTATDWTATYDVMAATAEVWRIKAGKVAGDYTFTADQASYNKSDVLAHCLEMEARYASMAGSPTGLGGSNSGTITVLGSAGVTSFQQYVDKVIP